MIVLPYSVIWVNQTITHKGKEGAAGKHKQANKQKPPMFPLLVQNTIHINPLLLNYSWAYKNARYYKTLNQLPWNQSSYPQEWVDYPLEIRLSYFELSRYVNSCYSNCTVSCWYSPASGRTPFYKDSYCIVWMLYILLNELLLQQSLSALNEWYPPVVFAYLQGVPVA